jgi:hypothetical protein
MLSGCSILSKKTEYIDREVYVYKPVPRSFLTECIEPELKGKKFRDALNLISDYDSALKECNLQIQQTKSWDESQRNNFTKVED